MARKFAPLLCFCLLMVGCGQVPEEGAPAPQATVTSGVATPRPTPQVDIVTETPAPTPDALAALNLDPEVEELFVSQSVQFVPGEGGMITVDDYTTSNKESIKLGGFARVDTDNGLNPNILTALDQQGNTYAYNPDFGWFKVPEVFTSVFRANEIENYTTVTEEYFNDGRANIVTSLIDDSSPSISEDSTGTQYWVTYNLISNTLEIGFFPNGASRMAQDQYPEQYSNTYFDSNKRPFAWTGFYRVILNSSDVIYVNARTSINEIQKGDRQKINLFFGYDEATYIQLVSPVLSNGNNELQGILMHDADKGILDITAILAPPDEKFDPNTKGSASYSSPNVASLQEPGELISLFKNEEIKRITELLSFKDKTKHHVVTTPITTLPKLLSKHILLAGAER